jgi:hypothetical protein
MGCCGVTYEDEVEEKITEYMKSLKNPDNTKKRILQEIKNDLIRRANTVDRYYYPYRMEDVDKTVNFYKNYISMRLKGFIEFYEVRNVAPKIEVAKKEEQIKKKDENNKDKDESDDESQKEKDENNNEIVISKKEPTKLNNNMNNVNNVNSEIKGENEDENEITNNKKEDQILDNNKSIEMDIVNQKKEEEINTDIKEQKENNNITENNTDLKKDETGENNELN